MPPMFTIEDKVVVWPELGQNPSVGRVANGDLLVLYVDLTDVMAGARHFLVRSDDGGHTWSKPQLVVESDLPDGGVGGTLTCLDDLCLISYLEGSDLKRKPNNLKRSRIIHSTDGGRTWSKPRPINEQVDAVMPLSPFGKITRIRATGELLMSAYWWAIASERRATGGQDNILSSTDDGATWSLKGHITRDPALEGYFIGETEMIELADGRLLAITRGNAEPASRVPFGFRSISQDGGATWDTEQINVAICEPRLIRTQDNRILLLARSWPGNIAFYYRPLRDDEREPGSSQKETVDVQVLDDYRTPVREFGLTLFTTNDDGRTWQPMLTMQNPRADSAAKYREMAAANPLLGHRYQAGYGDIVALGDDRYFVAYREADPLMPDLRPGLTYSHAFQRFIAGNIVHIR